MKYLMYLVREQGPSWDADDCEYRLCTERPEEYEEFKRVLVEPLDTSNSIDELFRG